MPEHPHRSHVFSIGDRNGIVVLMQATSIDDVDRWLHRVHMAAGLAFARTTSAEVAIRTIGRELTKLQHKLNTVIESGCV